MWASLGFSHSSKYAPTCRVGGCVYKMIAKHKPVNTEQMPQRHYSLSQTLLLVDKRAKKTEIGRAEAKSSSNSGWKKPYFMASGVFVGLFFVKIIQSCYPLLSQPNATFVQVESQFNKDNGDQEEVMIRNSGNKDVADIYTLKRWSVAEDSQSIEQQDVDMEISVENSFLSQNKNLTTVKNSIDRNIRTYMVAYLIIGNYLYANLFKSDQEEWSKYHQFGAALLEKLSRANMGIYIKIAQHLAQLEYLLPEEYIQTLRPLMYHAPINTWEIVKDVIATDLSKLENHHVKVDAQTQSKSKSKSTPDEIIDKYFNFISPKPVASASLAQVHIGELKNGRKVAIKVQHQGIRESAKADILTIEILVNLVTTVFPRFDYRWLVEEMKMNLPLELDFRCEVANMNKCRKLFQTNKQVIIPYVEEHLCSKRILVMEFMKGCQIDNIEVIQKNKINTSKLAEIVTDVFNKMVFTHGFVHCDPHAGNMLVSKDPITHETKVVLLDHGLYRTIKPDFRIQYCRLWKSILFGDVDGIRNASKYMLGGGDYESLYKIFISMLTLKPWENVVDKNNVNFKLAIEGTSQEKDVMKDAMQKHYGEINDILKCVPRDLLLLMKTNDCLRCVNKYLNMSSTFTFANTATTCFDILNQHRLGSMYNQYHTQSLFKASILPRILNCFDSFRLAMLLLILNYKDYTLVHYGISWLQTYFLSSISGDSKDDVVIAV